MRIRKDYLAKACNASDAYSNLHYLRPKQNGLLTRLFAFLFLAAFAAQTFSKAFIVFDYFANTAAFAQACINKAKPQLQCKGKCQMMKKLGEASKQETQNGEGKAAGKNETSLSAVSFYPELPLYLPVLKTSFTSFDSGKETKRPRSLLRPPIC